MAIAYLGLGSNLGDREGRLARARQELEARGARILRTSPVEETAPWGVTDQPLFLNQVLEIDFDGDPRALFEIAKSVEEAVGRVERYRWGPREIDVDILLFDELHLSEPDLVIPHPRLREREFLLRPLRELRPDLEILG